jgi:hypothetical protein
MYGGMQKPCHYRPPPNPSRTDRDCPTLRPASRDERTRQQASRSSNTITQIRSIDPAKGAALNRIGGTCWADGQFSTARKPLLAKLPRLPTVEAPNLPIIARILDDSKKAQREVTDMEDSPLSLDVPCVQDAAYHGTFRVQGAINQELHPSRRCRELAASALSTCGPGASPQMPCSPICG